MYRLGRLNRIYDCKEKYWKSWAGAVIILLVLLFVINARTVYAEDSVVELDLRKGDISIDENGYSQGGSGVSSYANPPKYIITSGGEETENMISVFGGKQNITLHDVHAETTRGVAALYLPPESDGIKVELTLEGDNILKGEEGIYLGSTSKQKAELSISDKSTGKVEIISTGIGHAGIRTYKNSVGIHGGTVIVRGGDGAAGIGGTYYEDCGDVTITGGHVEAYGGKAAVDRGAGSGIGNAFHETNGATSEIGSITISGGTVIAEGGGEGSAGIGAARGTEDAKRGTFILRGDAWADISSQNVKFRTLESGVLFDGEDKTDGEGNRTPAGKIYGESYSLPENMAIRANKTLQIEDNQTLRVQKGKVLTIEENGALQNEGTMRIQGVDCLTGSGLAAGRGNFYLFNDEFEITDEWHADGTDLTSTVRSRLTEIFETACTRTICREGSFKPENGWKLTFNPQTVRDAGEYDAIFTAGNDKVTKKFKVLTGNMVMKIEVTNPPAKTDYETGDDFDPSGIKVMATLQDGSTKDVTDEIKIEGDKNLKPGQTSVTIIYTDTYGSTAKASVGISVNKKLVDVSDIQLDEGPELIYNGEEQTKTFTGKLPEYIDMKVLNGNTGKDAGTYTAKIEFTIKEGYEDYYTFADGPSIIVDKDWTIAKKKLDWVTGDLDAVGNTRDDDAYIYGEIGVEGIAPVDKEDGKIPESFPSDKLTGSHGKQPGEDQEIQLEWKDENDRFELGNDGAAGNYELDELPVIKDGVINEVKELPLPPELESVEGFEFRMDIEERISRVPVVLLPQYKNPEEFEGWMIKELVEHKGVSQSYITTYDLTLMSRGEGETDWQRAGAGQVPENGLTITLPYPEGITKDQYIGIVSYIYPEDMNGVEAGTQIYLEVEMTDEGIRFVIPGPGPIAVGWKDVSDSSGGGGGSGGAGAGNGSGGSGDGDGDGDGGGSGGSGVGSGTGNGSGSSGGGSGTGNGSGGSGSGGSGSGAGILTGDNARFAVYAVLGMLSIAIIFVVVQIYKLDKKKVKR